MLRGNFENAISKYENTGSRLEDEFVGLVNNKKYKELAYNFLNPDELNVQGLSNDERFEKFLKIKEQAAQEFKTPADFTKNYIPRKQAMDLVEQCQTGDPERPNRFFARKLYDEVKEYFKEEDFKVKFFTAAGGTHLDVAHKIDCFFKLYNRKTDKEMACTTIDLTQYSQKTTASADILVNINAQEKDSYDPSRGNENYDADLLQKRIAAIAFQIKESLIAKYRAQLPKNKYNLVTKK